ncbi:F-box domain protein [Talaromyces proteolyticus]|uniref:F-box domain protein n=1 Tax=Talaromyces proteolyticus TaxID=1131652 RepID=A0AAD4KZC2_9EURO|nr:F-box domain protein [Talaromyces proteolyticus]KAH8703394.1 F-box domain protein [Talaromyces proteolyticus]
MPQKQLSWDAEPFPGLSPDSLTMNSPETVALNATDHRAATPVHLEKNDYFSSPCTSEDTGLSENSSSASGGSSPVHSGSESPSFESGWQDPVDQLPSAANIAPPEILFQIFSMLSPRDFDNARRTCSQWMRASLQQKLLESMVKRAGWWDAWQQDCQSYHPANGVEESVVWRLSKRFSTECVLSGRKANVEKSGFLSTGMVDFGQLSRESLPKESPGLSRDMFTGPAPRLTAAFRDPAFSRSIKFNVSGCGHYVLAATGCMIYVYYLGNRRRGDTRPHRPSGRELEDMLGDNDLDILPVSSIGCPYEVLSATIDTSTPKFVIAALLRGRIGMICDIKGVPVHPSRDRTSSLLRQNSGNEQLPKNEAVALNEIREAIASSAAIEEVATPDGRPPMPPRTVSNRRTMNRLTRTPRKYFHDLCSKEDPPRSVSICPGRRCVAFGCGSGIELHWFDERTQEDSRKLFPLSQPAEVLHFLPNRIEIDDISKLRLVSSLAGPGASGCQCHRAANGEDVICQFHLTSNANSFTHWTPRRNGRLSLVKATHCHHYRAIPVNDGLHILFIEPVSGLLCIGSDAPIGGPTNLTRAMICIPPFGNDISFKEECVPTVFSIGSDLNWGLRVVAAYRDRLVLYTVPVDVYNVLRRERERQGDGVMGDSDLARDWFLDSERNSKRRGSLAQNQNGDWEFLLRVSYRPTAMLWPLKIYGKEIGRMEKVVELSVQTSSGGVRVWAFGASGEARIFDIDTHTSKKRPVVDIAVKSMGIASDGSIGSAMLVDRAESGLLSPLPVKATRKRKQLSQPAPFDRKLLNMWKNNNSNPADGVKNTEMLPSSVIASPSRPSSSAHGPANRPRRTSFAACIMDLKIPELSHRDGQWINHHADTERGCSTVPCTPASESENTEFHDVASYDPQEIRRFYTVWSTSSANPSGRWR